MREKQTLIKAVWRKSNELCLCEKLELLLICACFKTTFCSFLGVVKGFRKQGIASFLLENLIAHLTTGENSHDVKAVYLHVLTTNNAAITFYEHRGFRPHLFLPYYYAIGEN